MELDLVEQKLKDVITDLYTIEVTSDNVLKKTEVISFNKIADDRYKSTYKFEVQVTIDGDVDRITPIEFDILKSGTNELKKMDIHIAIVNPVIKIYGGKQVSGASFHGLYLNKEKDACNIFNGKDEAGNLIEGKYSLEKVDKMIRQHSAELNEDKYKLIREFRLDKPICENIKLFMDVDQVAPEITNVNTWDMLLAISQGKTEFGRELPVTMNDIKFFDFREGLIHHLRTEYWEIRRKLKSQLGQRSQVYRSPLLVAIQQYITSNNSRLKTIQTTADSNAISVRAHADKVLFLPADGDQYIPLHSKFLDGVIDPTTTAENAGSTSVRNAFAYGCKLDLDNNPHIKCYTKDFQEVFLDYDTYINSRILAMDNVDYQTKQIHKINGKYKYQKRCRYHFTDTLNDIDYIRHPESLLSVETCTMSLMNRTNIIRNLIGSHFFTQAIPLEHGQPSIIYTQYNRKLYDEDKTSLRAEHDGVVEGINETGDIVKIRNTDGTLSFINCNEGENRKYMETVNHSYNVFNPQVKVGEHVKAGEPIFALNSYVNKEFAVCVPLLSAYTTLRGYEVEDGYCLSESAAKKFTHKGVKIIDVYLEKDHYRILDSNKLPMIGDRVEQGDTIMSYIQVTDVHEVIAKLFDSKQKIEEEIKIKLPAYSVHGKVVNVEVMINPQMDKTLVYYDKLKQWQEQTLAEKRRFLNNQLYGYEYKEPEDDEERENPCDAIIRIEVEFFDELKLSDKLSNRASTKGVVCKIVPDNEMPMTLDGRIIECIMPALSMCSRKNVYGVLEVKITKLCERLKTLLDRNEVTEDQWKILRFLYRSEPQEKLTREYILEKYGMGQFIRVNIEPYDKEISLEMVDDFLARVGIPDGGKEILIDQVTKKRIRNPILVGYNEYLRFHFLAQKKGTANPKIAYTDEVVMGVGKHKQEGQKWGKQEVEALLSHGLESFVVQVTNKIGNKRDAEIKSEFTNLLLRLS